MRSRPLFGCGTALVTPFRQDGTIDEPALRALVEWQIGSGVHFLVPCGSTGEAATMTAEEQRRVVEITVQVAAGRVPVVAGAGSNDTGKAIATSLEMKAAGATHLMHVSPMYNKPPQRGLIAHFTRIAQSVDLPIIIYNVPGRTAGNIEAATTLALAEIPSIVGVKEASGNLGQISHILRDRSPDFVVLSGDDALALPLMLLGGDGVISVVSNATPLQMVELIEACARGDWETARAMHELLSPWMAAAFVESNPIPVKAALALLGRIENVLRLPLVPLDAKHTTALRASLEAAGALAQ
ncbi:MAG: 4-hydroxy-tetrahydrodipicolinate synthase [Gemmatimonadetes bacterium]|nr:4-hydroxy-tetrahydrodipicolinate synthase [Gemmatimonadota bacterium]